MHSHTQPIELSPGAHLTLTEMSFKSAIEDISLRQYIRQSTLEDKPLSGSFSMMMMIIVTWKIRRRYASNSFEQDHWMILPTCTQSSLGVNRVHTGMAKANVKHLIVVHNYKLGNSDSLKAAPAPSRTPPNSLIQSALHQLGLLQVKLRKFSQVNRVVLGYR